MRLALITVLFLFISPYSFAEEKLAPHETSICSQILMAAPRSNGGSRGALYYRLRTVDGIATAAAQSLSRRELGFNERLLKALLKKIIVPGLTKLNIFPEVDFSAPHDFSAAAIYPDPMSISWTPLDEIRSSSLVGRIAQLKNDFVESEKLISYGFEVRGAEKIREYLERTLEATDRLEASMRSELERQFPYATNGRFLYHTLAVGLSGMLLYYLANQVIADVHAHSLEGLANQAILALIFIPSLVKPQATKAFKYSAGFIFQGPRTWYENRTNSKRTNSVASFYEDSLNLLGQRNEYPRALMYKGMTKIIPLELVAELLTASREKRELDYNVVQETIVRERKNEIKPLDRYFLLLDQVFFFDEQTQEPVLVNFIRLKHALAFNQRKIIPKIEPQKQPSREGWVPGFAR